MNGDFRLTPKAFIFFLVFLLILNFITTVTAEHEDDDEDQGENLGVVALGLLGIGAWYVIVRRTYSLINSLDKEKYADLHEKNRQIYRRIRKPLLLIHNWTMGISTIVGGIHGVLMFDGFDDESFLSGTIALIIMALISILGMIMFFRFKPLWEDKRTKKLIRFIHRQWILSVFLIIAIIIHIE